MTDLQPGFSRIDGDELRRRIAAAHAGEGEIAFLDLRERGPFHHAQILFSVNLPLSRLELEVARLVPRRSTPVVLTDGGEAVRLAARGAARLLELGYTDVAVLKGGLRAWQAAGGETFSGNNVPSKAFGEFVAENYHTPMMSADSVAAALEADRDLVILDSRPYDEFHRMSIPGGVNVPGAELLYRVRAMAPDPRTTVVVNCAGRTRSIIGAQSLVNAGIPNPVAALENGTMGWQLAGHGLAQGATAVGGAPDAAALAAAQADAARVAARFGAAAIDRGTIAAWTAEAGNRTLYLLDVRTAEEFAAGTWPGARHAPGGQLVQATDEYLATRGARIVLIDGEEVRAPMTAAWLRQLGFADTFWLAGGLAAADAVPPQPEPGPLDFREVETVSAHEAKAVLDSGEAAALIDLADSRSFERGHIPGAWWGVRARLVEGLVRMPAIGFLILTSPDAVLAHYGARDLMAARPDLIVRVLAGGTPAWTEAGLPLETGMPAAFCEPDDHWPRPYESPESAREAMQAYLDWEFGLTEQLRRDGMAPFAKV
ncbi:rhodanese-like domain-containing protein [Marinibaculum pumilum]|uniref:Rhodanese-like domain-containing protein n=1 Tax=Marinibaculum pumilum TaxID=1766165 RepID=A0ABV7L6D9_9PROT